MKTTYANIRRFGPCSEGWHLLIANTNPEMDMAKEISLMDILKSNGIGHAVWALRCFDRIDVCLFICDVAESVLPIFEKKHPGDNRPREAIKAVKDFKNGKISEQDLEEAFKAAYKAYTSADGMDATHAAHDAFYAAYSTCNYSFPGYALFLACSVVETAHTAEKLRKEETGTGEVETAVWKKWEEIKKLFIKHFGV